ncbi:LacI family DNA-binding transcriptional regulator [Naasia aerilata]|uniref:LacI family transcriptional regulator n=1 Tax=Naasia aerilata TaxID=1162966 RepID=A0ABN6XML9_9MICO|nr:LacI family DNA-binding transcriptional regulator [Naasia aerilata]BDZ46183.1 LacI family transcriptional regulator [Naasia aerilata]
MAVEPRSDPIAVDDARAGGEDDRARAATIFDVARLAGVSHQTVSRVINEHPNVRAATRERVQQAIQQLRYRPYTAARALVTRRSRTIGLITMGGQDWGPSLTAMHFNEAAREARYAVSMVSLLSTDEAALRDSVERLLRQSVEAVVLVAEDRNALQLLQRIELGVPLIALDPSDSAGTLTVALDQYAGARGAVRHLVELGHRSILHLAGPRVSPAAAERERGWRDELAKHGLVAREPGVGDWSPSSGALFGRQLDLSVPFTAVFSSNDQMAVGLMHVLVERGLSVPADVSVVGFDDIPEAEYLMPPLTTVRQDFERLGRDMMARVAAVLSEVPEIPPARAVPELIVRASTAPPPSKS